MINQEIKRWIVTGEIPLSHMRAVQHNPVVVGMEVAEKVWIEERNVNSGATSAAPTAVVPDVSDTRTGSVFGLDSRSVLSKIASLFCCKK